MRANPATRPNPGGDAPALGLSADPSGWRVHGLADHREKRLLSAARQVLARDRYTCRCCGFVSTSDAAAVPQPGAVEVNERAFGYLEVHPRSGDHARVRVEDLDAVCPFCHETLHCGAGTPAVTGTIILCPWLAQADLCLLMNAMAVASAEADADAIVVNQLWAHLESLRFEAETQLGVERLECGVLASALLVLRDSAPPLYDARDKAIGALRYLVDRAIFARAVAYWREAVWRPVGAWDAVYRRWLRVPRA